MQGSACAQSSLPSLALTGLLLVPCLFSFVSESLVCSAIPHDVSAKNSLAKPTDQTRNRPYPLSLSPNYLWILAELFLSAKVKFWASFPPWLLRCCSLCLQPVSTTVGGDRSCGVPMWHCGFIIRWLNLFSRGFSWQFWATDTMWVTIMVAASTMHHKDSFPKIWGSASHVTANNQKDDLLIHTHTSHSNEIQGKPALHCQASFSYFL